MNRAVTLAGYAVLLGVAVGLEVAARRGSGATLGEALRRLVRRWPVRLLVLAAWLWFGWHVFVRVDWQ
jgi:Family of unknown function (DUF6186)